MCGGGGGGSFTHPKMEVLEKRAGNKGDGRVEIRLVAYHGSMPTDAGNAEGGMVEGV